MFRNTIKKLAAVKFLSITTHANAHIAQSTAMTNILNMFQDITTSMFANQHALHLALQPQLAANKVSLARSCLTGRLIQPIC